MSHSSAYSSIDGIIEGLSKGDIQGALLDTYIAGEYQDQLNKYKLQEILEHLFVYGIVLARDAAQLENRIRTFTEQKQSTIYNTISKAIKPLKVRNNIIIVCFATVYFFFFNLNTKAKSICKRFKPWALFIIFSFWKRSKTADMSKSTLDFHQLKMKK